MSQRFDSILFDMDGTLWDAVESYCAVWNHTIDAIYPEVPHVGYGQLARLMGKPLETIFDTLIGTRADRDSFMAELTRQEEALMPRLGGKLYPGVRETIGTLSRTHRLFMVSNCTAGGLPNFLRFTGLAPYFTDDISFGQTGREKDANIATMIERYNLQAPLYVGDTQGDCMSAHRAGVPFAWASYGFGRDIIGADFTLPHITDLPDIC